MRSRPDAARRRLEAACRLGVFALLGWMLGNAFLPGSRLRGRHSTGDGLAAALPEWTRAARTDLLSVALDRAPTRAQLDWLGALKRAGHVVTWTGSVPAVALSVEPLPAPDGAARFSIAAPAADTLLLRGSLGDDDSIITGKAGGVQVLVPRGEAGDQVIAGSQQLGPARGESAAIKPLLVIGTAGWESKFTAAALEEAGWTVATRFAVAPGVTVGNGARVPIDTSGLSAVVALDTTVSVLGSALARFVRDGGGLVLAGDAASAANVMGLAAGAPGPRVPAMVAVADTLGIASAGYVPIARLTADAEVVESRGRDIVVAARRIGAGRVIQTAYDETWRWRMAGGPLSEAEHRAWWSRLASTAAFATLADTSGPAAAGHATMPRAAVVQALGAPRDSAAPSAVWSVDQRWLLAVIFILLLIEWGSRRMRGSR